MDRWEYIFENPICRFLGHSWQGPFLFKKHPTRLMFGAFLAGAFCFLQKVSFFILCLCFSCVRAQHNLLQAPSYFMGSSALSVWWVRMDDEKHMLSQSLDLHRFSNNKWSKEVLSIDLANVVILVFVFFWENPFCFQNLLGCWIFRSRCFFQNGCKVLSIRRITGESGILDPIKFR